MTADAGVAHDSTQAALAAARRDERSHHASDAAATKIASAIRIEPAATTAPIAPMIASTMMPADATPESSHLRRCEMQR